MNVLLNKRLGAIEKINVPVYRYVSQPGITICNDCTL